jgi:surface antigen
MKKLIISALALFTISSMFSGCAVSNTAGGAVAGATLGAVDCAKLGNHNKAMIGAAGGAVAGAMIGKEMDDQEREARAYYRQ